MQNILYNNKNVGLFVIHLTFPKRKVREKNGINRLKSRKGSTFSVSLGRLKRKESTVYCRLNKTYNLISFCFMRV